MEVTSKEFSLLEYLARRQGDVVSKSELIEHVWDFAYDGDVNVVEVHISHRVDAMKNVWAGASGMTGRA